MSLETHSSPHFVRKQLLRHPPAYLESIGKTDIATLASVFDFPDGQGTVLRLIMGATREMPLRALSYVESALRVAEVLPAQQIQLVHANNLGNRINGVDIVQARRQSELMAHMAAWLIASKHPELAGKVLHAEDTPIELGDIIPFADLALDSTPAIQTVLRSKGIRHQGEFVDYTAAHVAFQDTNRLKLRPILDHASNAAQVSAERIVSIGCQQERPFYLARMIVRNLIEAEDIDLVGSAQLFTKHYLPPYFTAREGEVSIERALSNGFRMGEMTDRAAHRDMLHFTNLVESGV